MCRCWVFCAKLQSTRGVTHWGWVVAVVIVVVHQPIVVAAAVVVIVSVAVVVVSNPHPSFCTCACVALLLLLPKTQILIHRTDPPLFVPSLSSRAEFAQRGG